MERGFEAMILEIKGILEKQVEKLLRKIEEEKEKSERERAREKEEWEKLLRKIEEEKKKAKEREPEGKKNGREKGKT